MKRKSKKKGITITATLEVFPENMVTTNAIQLEKIIFSKGKESVNFFVENEADIHENVCK